MRPPRSYTVTVTATDPSGLEDGSIPVTINVDNVDEPGTVSISPSQFQVGTELTASLTDPDGTISGVTWQWDKADTDDTYSNVGSSASYTPTAADVDKFLRATATYTDPQGSGKSAESVSDSAVEAAPPTNEAPEFPATRATRTVAENTAAGTNFGTAVTATDSVGDTLTYTLGGTDVASFGIVASTGQLQTKAELDHETKDSYTVEVSVSDGKDANGNADTADDASIRVTITVTDENDAPAFSAEPDTRTIPENTPADQNIGAPVGATDPDSGDTLTYTLGGDDADSFTVISTSGQLQTKAELDHETKPTYTVTVSVRDSKDAGGNTDSATDDTVAVTITVTNVEEPGTVTFSNPTPQARIELTASLEDPDEIVTGSIVWQWAIKDTSGSNFGNVAGAIQASYTPDDNDVDKHLRATATYTDGHGENKTAQGEPGNAVRVAHNPNQPPTFTEDPPNNPITFSIAENTPAGQDIGTPVTATDPDRTDTIAYSLGTPSASVFHIVSDTGQIQTKGSLDHETKATYTVTVTATDPSNESDTTDITITVTDVDEPPGKPDGPTVTAKTGTHDTLTVTWDAPDNTGPDITSYAVQYRKHDVTEWSTVTGTITGLTADITDLPPDTEYSVRVQATNDEGTGEWSDEGSGTTAVKPQADWVELTVDYGAATYTVTEGNSVDITVELSGRPKRTGNWKSPSSSRTAPPNPVTTRCPA